jgi:hypothetical protein
MTTEKMAGTNLNYQITGEDIDRYLQAGSTKILKYSELANYRTVEELLPDPVDYRIILIEQNENTGHWCCILRYKKVIEWFDPYGIKPDGELSFISKMKNRILGQDTLYLTNLFTEATRRGWTCIYNKKRLQQLKKGISTCGRWCLLRITMLTQMYYDLPDFIAFIEKTFEMEGSGISKDKMICNWIK